MQLIRYYKRAVALPSGIIILGYILYTIYDLTIGPSKDYESEWLNPDAADVILIGMVILHCGIVALLCSTIFLIHFSIIRMSPILTFMSWFLLPMIYMGYLMYLPCRSVYSPVNVPVFYSLILSLTLPFIFGLILTFIKFRNRIVDRSDNSV